MSSEIVKSCARVLEVLRLFSESKRSLSAAEVCQHLGYPKSSANALLKSLVQLGYLSLDTESIRYFPTLRITRLGDWIPGVLLGSGEASGMLQSLHNATQETVTLSMQNGLYMEFIRVIVGAFSIALQMKEGHRAPLFGTSVGTAALSAKEDSAIRDLYDRAAGMQEENHPTDSLEDVMQEVRLARERGYAIAYDRLLPDSGAVACPLFLTGVEHTLVIAAGGPTERIIRSENAIASELLRLRNQHQWRQKQSRKSAFK
ncbi:MAG: DNA-binding IclR family transcriptional regulator [Halieaceae bacterium]|jgi:DNA-binding IclR family transcriptional regulator